MYGHVWYFWPTFLDMLRILVKKKKSVEHRSNAINHPQNHHVHGPNYKPKGQVCYWLYHMIECVQNFTDFNIAVFQY